MVPTLLSRHSGFPPLAVIKEKGALPLFFELLSSFGGTGINNGDGKRITGCNLN